MNLIETCILEEELEIPHLLSDQRMIEMEATVDSIAIFDYSHFGSLKNSI